MLSKNNLIDFEKSIIFSIGIIILRMILKLKENLIQGLNIV